MYTSIENNPIQVDLLTAANDTGWSQLNGIATHVACNSGYITLLNYPVTKGNIYQITYTILTISGGYLAAFVGGTEGTHHTTADIYVETITATADGVIKLFSNANCTVQLFNLKNLTVNDGVTIVMAAKTKKWSDFRTMYPTFGFSIQERSVVWYLGNGYVQQNGSMSRNNFFGEQFQSSIQFVEAKEPVLLKTYNSLVLQSNQLLVTDTDGITTSLGQISELAEIDFIKGYLNDGISNVQVVSQEGIFSACFLRDKNSSLLEGEVLKGNWITVTLTSLNGSAPLQLFSVAVNASQSKIGAR